ncbi:MAG: alkane 1-monooxygenase [Bacteroidetes bacterium]|nr:alkane 1-monooxygenase [Bacteroidota bacterium]
MFGKFKYLFAFILPALAVVGFYVGGIWSFSTLVFSFVCLPLFEFAVGTDRSSLQNEFTSRKQRDAIPVVLVSLSVPIQFAVLIAFLYVQKNHEFSSLTYWGNITAMGMMCGVFGINVAHELGHSPLKRDQLMSKALLCTSLYMHFFVEHNKGHHKWVGTAKDPATARLNESIYHFYLRVIPHSFVSAWRIAKEDAKRKKNGFFNEVLLYVIIELTGLTLIYALFGWKVFLSFILAAVVGILLLETVNYIEHYGLFREKITENRFEDVAPIHSWNSDFILGRIVLFELTRHSDHHANPERPYEHLRSLDNAGQLPAGYPSMMLLALVPFAWFKIMNPLAMKVKNLQKNLAD